MEFSSLEFAFRRWSEAFSWRPQAR